jgi:transcriptional regulator GlxA family with amidase domain
MTLNDRDQGVKIDELTFHIILSDDYVLMELAGVLDVLRITNRVLGYNKFNWQLFSKNGGEVSSSAGAFVNTEIIPKNVRPDYAIFLGNTDMSQNSFDVEKYAAGYRHAKSKVILLSTAASWYITSNQEKAAVHTTHWENRVLLEEKQGLYGVKSSLAVSDGQVVTCAGMGATADVILALVGGEISSAKLTVVSKIILHDRIRTFDTLQPEILPSFNRNTDTLQKAIKIMQENIEHPVTMSDLAKMLGRTPRWLERNFKSSMGSSPGRYYRELRMNHAHSLLRNTNMSIQEIALACGCQSGFTLAYQQSFGRTPHQARKARLDKM